jgi:serine/threonine-protein kinase HipA
LTPVLQKYSPVCLRRVFNGKSVSCILPFDYPEGDSETQSQFRESKKYLSISGVQEKYPLILEKNKLRLVRQGEISTHILKPVPLWGKKPAQMPANEHLTMQIARLVYGMETAENALIYFRNGIPAYITKRFDVQPDGSRLAQEDFASLAGRTPQTHGEHYKYKGNYLELFQLMQKYVPAYRLESLRLFKLLVFNYLFSNGDAHFKNFSLVETPMGDYRLSPAYDLLNSRLHVEDSDFALEDGLLPPSLTRGKIVHQFYALAENAGITYKQRDEIFRLMTSGSDRVEALVADSFLDESTRQNYWQLYQKKLKNLTYE